MAIADHTHDYKITKKEYWLYPLFFVISIIFLSVFSSSTSPFFNAYGGDSSVFIMLGKLFREGKIPYVEYFDHKGPFVIFIEAIGLSLSSNERTGIFILQIINLSIVQILAYRCARCLLCPKASLAALFLLLLLFSITIQGGNLTEEYSLPFTFAGLLFTLKYARFGRRLKSYEILIIGVSIGILFWLRPNNMGVLCASVLFLFISFIKSKEYKEIYRLIIYSVSGFSIITISVILYFIKINALPEMIYATFTFNLKYIEAEIISDPEPVIRIIVNYVKQLTALLVLFIGMIVYYIKNKEQKLLLLSILLVIFGWLTTFIGKSYSHYMTLNLPCFLLGIAMLLDVLDKKSKIKNISILYLISAFVFLCGYTVFKYNSDTYQKSQDDTIFIINVKDVVSKIPQTERNSVYIQGVYSRFWTISGLIPCRKYFISQDWHSVHDPHIKTELYKMIKNNPPLWIVTSYKDYDNNPDVWKTIDKTYTLYYKNVEFELYRLKQ